MPVYIPRSDPWYLTGAGLACATAVSVTAFAAYKYAAVWKFALHPVFNSIGLGLMALGILEQGNRITPLVHVGLMAAAALCFFLGWLFMFLQHREGGKSHFATESPWWHKAHVYMGYALLACWLTQVAGGIAKYMKLPEKSVKWHGILAHVMFTIKVPQFAIAAIMSLWVEPSSPQPASGSRSHPTAKDTFADRHISEFLFILLFCMLYVAVMIAFFKVGVRVESSTALKGTAGGAPGSESQSAADYYNVEGQSVGHVSDDAASSPRPEGESRSLLGTGDNGKAGAAGTTS
mmetsp:Transcript_10609/g.25905  ORF Transcript_10609/g.25905 Transcript_10609/m.25905 type:complete len:291 (-) Transcript_10609:448-1320(-)|eukprot:CAMPEP_0178988948 /NCGR_PEP_ID=MMETSP0795-20121207/4082_1 /TAXON_ID=88552 /ORGANISM="Amoebophrya sp., Strain Ameob2" /LENGTH=290 /DNA_ID=CAMNT_0020680255 /DNA_START=267 /DNA_END=1139 /DNA_ORIENTATION=+